MSEKSKYYKITDAGVSFVGLIEKKGKEIISKLKGRLESGEVFDCANSNIDPIPKKNYSIIRLSREELSDVKTDREFRKFLIPIANDLYMQPMMARKY